MLIVLQDFPDPDAIAAAAALKEIANTLENIVCSIACGGVLGRAENRMLVRYLDINLLSMEQVMVDDYDVLALVDTQPGTGNNALPEGTVPDVVIDHHPIKTETRSAAFHDIRRKYGSTSTIMYEYIIDAGITPNIQLCTALLYGIRSDTNDLGRDSIQADVDATIALYPNANVKMLGRIKTERLPKSYFQMLTRGLNNTEVYGKCVISGLGFIDNPDMIGEFADLLLRVDTANFVLCYGFYDDKMLVSLRTFDTDADSGKLIHRIIGKMGTGGGHNEMAGGQISIKDATKKDIKKIEQTMITRLLRFTSSSSEKPDKLVSV